MLGVTDCILEVTVEGHVEDAGSGSSCRPSCTKMSTINLNSTFTFLATMTFLKKAILWTGRHSVDMPSCRGGTGRDGGGGGQEPLDAGHVGQAERRVEEASGRGGQEQTRFHDVAYQALLG